MKPMTKLEKTLVENEETLSPEVVEFPFDSPEERIETMLKCSVEEPAEQCKVLVRVLANCIKRFVKGLGEC